VKKAAIVERLHALGRHADAIRLDRHEEEILDATDDAAVFARLGIPASAFVDDAARDPRTNNF
jgi:hypothetical protein